MTISTHRTKVARMIPAFLIKNLFRSFFILVITKHHILTPGNNFAWNICRVWTNNLYFHVQGRCTTRAWNKVFIVTKGYQRTTLCSSIHTCYREINTYQEVFNLLIKRCSTCNYLIRISSKGLHHNRTDSFLHLLTNNRHLQQHSRCRTLHLWKDILTDNLFYYHRHSHNNGRMNVSTSLGNQ